jgi:hypothetical protein
MEITLRKTIRSMRVTRSARFSRAIYLQSSSEVMKHSRENEMNIGRMSINTITLVLKVNIKKRFDRSVELQSNLR